MKPRDPALEPGPWGQAWKKLRRNKVAMAAGVLLILLYAIAVFAGFFSPYSPTSDEFREHFFHPPDRVNFTDRQGSFHLRPSVDRTYLIDPADRSFASSSPIYVFVRDETANTNAYLPDSMEGTDPVLTVFDANGNVLQAIMRMQETGPDTSIFAGRFALDSARWRPGETLIMRTASGNSTRVTVVNRPPGPASAAEAVYVGDPQGKPLAGCYPHVESLPVRFFVRGWPYRVLWLFDSDLHLFGVDRPAHIFLLGSDQSGRDIFSRLLHGARISLTIGLLGVLLTTLFGLVVGSIAGYYGGTADNVLMRFAELVMSIPALYLILGLRNVIPNRMQETYDRLQRIATETFAWQHSATTFAIVLAVVSLSVVFWYRRRPSTTRITVCICVLVAVAFGRQISDLALAAAERLLPGSTHVTSDWNYLMIIAILSTVGWAGLSRVIRGMVLAIREQDYVQAARAMGASDARVIARHILPNTFGYVIVRATLLIPAYILGEVALSFLGMGVQEPIPSWGNMLSSGQSIRVLQQFSWCLAPGILIFLTVLAYNFLGDGLRDAFDPKQN